MHYQIPTSVNSEVFRTYDIRGQVGEHSINENLAYAIGLAFGSMARSVHQHEVIVGKDGRLSGPSLTQALIAGLRTSGCDVIDIGMVSTPMLYFATHAITPTGIMVTGSHNPRDDNGFKTVLAGMTLTSAGVQDIYQRIINRNFTHGDGKYRQCNILENYIAAICNDITLHKKLKIVIDCGNGVGAIAAPQIFRQLGCEVIELFCDVDGNFPNHHPDPTIPANLEDLISTVHTEHADIGLAFDGDADRVGVVTNEGQIIWPDRQMLLFVQEVCASHPNREIIFDVKCTNNLPAMITSCGGKPIMNRTGHSLIKAKMKELNAPLAGEMSGHIFFNDSWFGFDDGIYVGARLLQILANREQSFAEIAAELPNSHNTPELKMPIAEADKAPLMARLIQHADFGNAHKITMDGLRVDFGYGWGLIRPSNTSPYLTLRFEADTAQNLKSIQECFKEQLLKLDSTLKLPF